MDQDPLVLASQLAVLPIRVALSLAGELLPAWRHHAVFTDSPFPILPKISRWIEADTRWSA
jgi:hypothetical protein